MKQNNMKIFNATKQRSCSKEHNKLVQKQKDSNLFCRMVIACQSRQDEDFFSHENFPFTLSISGTEVIHPPPSKSDIVTLLTYMDRFTEEENIDFDQKDVNALFIHGTEFI